jgi:hypothetical protein
VEGAGRIFPFCAIPSQGITTNGLRRVHDTFGAQTSTLLLTIIELKGATAVACQNGSPACAKGAIRPLCHLVSKVSFERPIFINHLR